MKEKIKDYIVGNYSEEFFNQIWSDKNTEDDLKYTAGSRKKLWFKCPNGIHEDFQRKLYHATRIGFTCSKCNVIKQHQNYIIDLTGQKFGKWTVVERDFEYTGRGIRWFCDCDCGTKHVSVSTNNLRMGKSLSCGCSRHENCGENNGNWKGGTTPEIKLARNSLEYTKWRDAVFKRDNYTCQCCGEKSGKINAHHIENFSDKIELRYDINNGITLCERCHLNNYPDSFHSIYGIRNNNRLQLEEYLRNHKLKFA